MVGTNNPELANTISRMKPTTLDKKVIRLTVVVDFSKLLAIAPFLTLNPVYATTLDEKSSDGSLSIDFPHQNKDYCYSIYFLMADQSCINNTCYF